MINFFKKININKSVLFLSLISLLIVIIWFRDGLIFAGGEEGLTFYNLSRHLKLIAYLWYDTATGIPTITYLPRLPYFFIMEKLYQTHISSVALQSFTFFILILTGTLSVFYISREFIDKNIKNSKYIYFISGLFYLLNPFSMIQIWGRSLYVQFFAFALIPFFLLMFILLLKTKKLFFGFFALFSSAILATGISHPALIAGLWVPVLFFLLFHIFEYRKNRKEVIYSTILFFLIIAGWVMINMWWILPYFINGNQVFSSYLVNATEYNLGSLRGVSRTSPFALIIRLLHGGYLFESQYYGPIYLNFFFSLISWIIPLSLLFSLSIFKKLKSFKFFSILLLLSLFISLGSNPPFGWFFEWLFINIPFMQAFRNPYEKFGLILLIAYVPFFAIGITELSQWISKRFFKNHLQKIILSVFIFLVCIIYVWPLWTGQFAGGIKNNPWVKVPKYYVEANDWFNNQEKEFRIINIPLNNGDGIKFSNWQHSYQGIEPSEYLFDKSVIGKNFPSNKVFYNVLLQQFGVFQPNAFGPDPDISQSDFKSQHLYQELAKLNIRFIILHKDIDTQLSGMKTISQTVNYLTKEPNIHLVKSFGDLDIYQVNIPDNIDLIYSPDTKTTFKKINPTLYQVFIENATENTKLYFLENFDSNWQAYDSNHQLLKKHNKIFSYANSWDIGKKGNSSITIKYQPQDYVDKGIKVSFITGTLIFLTSCSQLLFLRFNKH